MSRKNAQKTFETFHSRAIEPVHPFEHGEAEFLAQTKFPDFVCVGRAIRILYGSDKWNEVGDVVGYYHDHGPDDGAHVFKPENRVQLYAPRSYFPDMMKCRFPVSWPKEVTFLGTCDGWVAQPKGRGTNVIESSMKGCILVCSPFGHVDKRNDGRVFLAVIDTETGIVECIVSGPGLTVTENGIEG